MPKCSKLTSKSNLMSLFEFVPCLYPLACKAIGGCCDSEFLLCVCICSSLVRFLLFESFEKLKSNYNQTWFKDEIGVPSYVNEVKGQVPRSRVIWGQVRWKMLVFIIWSPLKSWSPIGTKQDAIGVPLYVNEVKGHVPRSRVIWGQVRWKM